MNEFVWAFRRLARHRLRTALAIAGIAVSAAMLLDMVLLSGGIEQSFAQLLAGRGFQLRVSPRGTLPMDTDATIPDVTEVVAVLRRDPAVAQAGALLGAAVFAQRGAAPLAPLHGFGVEPAAQGIYQLEQGRDLAPGDTTGVLLSDAAARRLGASIGDTLVFVGRLDPQLSTSGVARALVVRGRARFLYDARDQASIATALPVLQRLTGHAAEDRASVVMVRAHRDADAPAVAARLAAQVPRVEPFSIERLVRHFRDRLVYFRQLALILGSTSLVVTVLLVGTLLTITVNERLGEIAALRAIGVSRGRIVREVLVEGTVMTVVGGTLGVLLGLATARQLDAILTSFPGLPQAFSFFVPEAGAIRRAALVLLGTGALAGLWPAWIAARAPIAATLRAEGP